MICSIRVRLFASILQQHAENAIPDQLTAQKTVFAILRGL